MKLFFHRRPGAAPVLLGLAVLILAGCSTEVKPPQGYALIYGVADYSAAGLGSLNYTDDDAWAMAELFLAQGWDVKLRIDDGDVPGNSNFPDPGPATLTQLKADIAALADVPRGSRFLINISSHGAQASYDEGLEPAAGDHKQEWFFLYSPVNLQTEFDSFDQPLWNPAWEDYVLQDDYLGVLLSQLPEGMKMVVVDACHSGGLIGDSPTVDPYPQAYQGREGTISLAEALNKYYNYDPRADILAEEALVLAAAGERESSIEMGGINHGLFTYHFLQSPVKADADGDGWITFGEAADYSISATVGYQQSLIRAYEEDPVNNTFYSSSYLYLPRLSGSGVDFVLFQAD